MGKFEEAISYYEKSLKLQPAGNCALFNNLGKAYEKIGNLNRALECFDNALILKPNDFAGLFNKGSILDDLKKSDEALKVYE